MRICTIKAKLISIILTACCLSVFIAVGFLSFYSYHNAKKNLEAEIGVTASLIIDNVTGALAFDDYDRAAEILGTLSANESVVQACLFSKDGFLVSSYVRSDYQYACSVEPENEEQIASSAILVSKDIVQGHSSLGSISIHSETKKLKAFINKQIFFVVGTLGLVLLAVSLPMANMLQRVISKPITDLVATTNKLAIGYHPDPEQREEDRDEIKFIQHNLSHALPYLKDIQAHIAQVNNALAISRANNALALKYIENEANVTYKASEVFKRFLEKGSYGKVDPHYFEILDVTMDNFKKFQGSITNIDSLKETEQVILQGGKERFCLEDVVTSGYENIFLRGDSLVKLNVNNNLKDPNWIAYKDSVRKMTENIFLLFDVMRLENIPYAVNISLEEVPSQDSQLAVVTYQFMAESIDALGNHDMAMINTNADRMEQTLFNIKFFQNINTPNNDSCLRVDLFNQGVVVSSLLPMGELPLKAY